ncbi:MAG: D-alanine-D-alanine ligase [Solirubrobacteraceae bacterium]|nr:D-alanine-D-alanine ligase [Solirubrobacteraceae bacterium]
MVAIEIGRDGVWRDDRGEMTLHPASGLLEADVAFPVLHGPFGEDGTVQGLLECLDVPYVGAGVAASALCMDKVLFKELMGRRGVPQVDYRAVRDSDWRDDAGAVRAEVARLGLPVFVKPARLGSSVGIGKVAADADLGPALESAFAHDPLAIVEGFSGGLEVECSVIGNDSPTTSEPGEIVFSREFYDYEAKYEPGGMDLVVPARIPDSVRSRVRELAAETFREAGCAGLARVDFFVEDERVLVNELNTMPGFTETSVFGKLFAASGVPYPQLLTRLVDLALERHAAERRYAY